MFCGSEKVSEPNSTVETAPVPQSRPNILENAGERFRNISCSIVPFGSEPFLSPYLHFTKVEQAPD